MSRRSLAVVAVLGLVAGGALAALLVGSWGDPVEEDHERAAEAFVGAWERSRLGTYVVLSEFHRVTARGGELESPVEVVQRPPDYLIRQFGAVRGRLGDRRVACGPDPAGNVQCDQAGERLSQSYEDGVRAEVTTWHRYFFEGDPPLYRVRADGSDCYDLTLTRAYPSPPYGNAARFCFDDGTGALVFVRVERDEGTDTTRAVEVRREVTDGDFRL